MNDAGSESELLRASLAGSKEAFGVVVQRYQSLVCAIAYNATGDVGASEELAQETFLRVWKNLPQLQDLNNFRAWLCTIARNLISQSIRAKPRDVIQAVGSLEQAEVLAAATPDPGQAALDKERQEIVWAAVRRVPQKYREPLVLFYREQRSVSQVAADLGLSEPVVRQRLHRGRRLIKAEVASLVEDTLVRSGPGKAFTVAVVAALPALITPTASAAVVGIAAKGTPVTKTFLAAGLSGVILGPILALLGGILGVWCGIRTTKSSRERGFMVRLVFLVYVLLFVLVGLPLTLTLAGLIPRWAHWSCLGVFFVILVPLIFWSYAHQQRIQIKEGTCRGPERGLAYVPRPGVRGSFAGPIFGATLWLLILTGLAGDWVSFSVIVGCDILLWLGATALCVRHPQRYWSVALLMVCALLAMTLAAVNLRWTAWMGGYRQSPVYDPRNDVSLLTLNTILLGLFIALVALFATQYVRHKAPPQDQTPDSGPQPPGSELRRDSRAMKSNRLFPFVCWAALLLGAILTVLTVARSAGLPARVVSIMVTASAVICLLATLLDRLAGRRLDAWLRRVDRRAVVAGFLAAMVSGLLYSVVHEFGHVVFAGALGGTVESVTWTIFGSVEPHVSYGHLPTSAVPWAWAGGYLFPTAVALLLIAAWHPRRRRSSAPAAAVLLISAAMMLLPNLGCLPELFDEQHSHFGRFASYYGLGRRGEVLVSFLFVGASIAVLTVALLAWKNAKRAATE